MDLEETIGFCLASQQIRKWVDGGKIIVPDLDLDKIQASSFDPTIGDVIYSLDPNRAFRPRANKTVMEALSRLNNLQRKGIDISNGYVLMKGHSYLIPLNERLVLNDGEYVRSLSKSSIGRTFTKTRLVADFNPCFDELNFQYKIDNELNLYLLVQPFAFNIKIHPGISLNQLRFFKGLDAKLNDREISEEFDKNPFLYLRDLQGKPVPVDKRFINEGLLMHLDLSGENTEGVIGFKARENDIAIDLSKIRYYELEEFFVPLFANNSEIQVKRGEHCLFASKELFDVPKHLSLELIEYSKIGIIGPLHYAGFIDPGFRGYIVDEVTSEESGGIVLKDGMPISKLLIYRMNEVPDKCYGEKNNSYKDQQGAKPPKFFITPDFKFLARNYDKLKKEVLVQERKILLGHRTSEKGFEEVDEINRIKLFESIGNGFFQSRYHCEKDEMILQPAPYVIIFGPDNTVFCYKKADNREIYGEKRLHGKYSIGLGGHINKEDEPNLVRACIKRECLGDKVKLEGIHSAAKFFGTIFCDEREVDRHHVGLVYGIYCGGDLKIVENSVIENGAFFPIKNIIDDILQGKDYETWSSKLCGHLNGFYDIIKQR